MRPTTLVAAVAALAVPAFGELAVRIYTRYLLLARAHLYIHPSRSPCPLPQPRALVASAAL